MSSDEHKGAFESASSVLHEQRQSSENDVRLVYCTYCNKTHAVKPDETPCAPGAWLDPEPIR